MSKHRKTGLYEQLITSGLDAELAELCERWVVDREPVAPAEVPDRLALHLGRLVAAVVAAFPEKDRASRGVRAARALVDALAPFVDDRHASLAPDVPLEPATLLRSVRSRNPDGSPRAIEPPLTPLLDTTLLTNAPGEPRLVAQIRSEIDSSDRIDLVVAFIRRSGIRPFTEALRRHCDDGRPLRVLTTTYTGSTEADALDALRDIGAEVRVSYDTSSTRLHAKSWLLHRDSGFSTAFIGSSNLTHSAQQAGLEWNVRVSGARNPDVIDKVAAVFDAYWEAGDFKPYDREEFAERVGRERPSGPSVVLGPFDVRPYPFQERLLEQIALRRRHGHHRNLLVAATGTGKTVMAAIDYKRLRSGLPRARLLFVAHRKEILDQSIATFRHVLRDATFGERWVGGARPRMFEHVFASIQSLHRADLEHLEPDRFDVVIVDEFHHAAAASYERLLEHIEPRELLGLTATPERADGLPILHWFGGAIAAELRLWDAIDQQRLSPFVYYGLAYHDVDFSGVPWKRGRGYDVDGLTNVLTASDVAAKQVVEQLRAHVDDPDGMRALGFCVSVEHARFMARFFERCGIRAAAVSAKTPPEARETALRKLARGELKVVFSVDLFNEGVDVPAVDTLLLLRPTDSPTLFLQQLGRGLRRDENKTACVVLDFVGHHRKEFRFDRRMRALLGGTRRSVAQQIEQGFPYLPAGCHMELDRVATDEVLRSIREAVPSRWPEKVGELRALAARGSEVSLAAFLDEAGLELEDVYTGGKSWSDLAEDAGLDTSPAGPHEAAIRRAVGRMLHVDDDVRIDRLEALSRLPRAPEVSAMDERTFRLTRMLVASLVGEVVDKAASLQDGVDTLWRHPQVLREIRELVAVLRTRVAHLTEPLPDRPEVPLVVHARYTRVEILAGFGDKRGAKVAAWQTGVRWLAEANADLFAFTLVKNEKAFSPTTRYRDYAISRELIHWESQSVVREASRTGLRYQQHEARGSDVMLFARLHREDRAFWFLGPATYVRHAGERPMGIVWRLEHPLPGDLYAQFAAAVG